MAGKTTEEGRARIELDEFDRELLSSDPAAEEAAQVLQDAGRSPYASSDDATIAGVWDLDPANGVFEAPADMPERVPRAVSIDGGPEFGAWAAATSDGRVEENEAGCVAARFDLATALRVADWINSLSGEDSIRFDPAAQAFLEYDGDELVAASPADEWGLYEVSPGAIWDDAIPEVPPEYPADALRPDLVSRREGLARQADMRTRAGDAQLRALAFDPSPSVRLEVADRGFALEYLSRDPDLHVKAQAKMRSLERGRFVSWRPELAGLPAALEGAGEPLPDAVDKLIVRREGDRPGVLQYAYRTELANGSAFCHGELDLARRSDIADAARDAWANGELVAGGGERARSMSRDAIACVLALSTLGAGDADAPISRAFTGEGGSRAAADAMWELRENPRLYAAAFRAKRGAARPSISGEPPKAAAWAADTPRADKRGACAPPAQDRSGRERSHARA